MLLYAATIFVSAFLLFLVQPIIAKQILPWFGGSSAVWTTCVFFFQFFLLGGYAYAHALVRFLAPRPQLLVLSRYLRRAWSLLPIVADGAWKPAGMEDSRLANSRVARRHGRPPVLPALDHQPRSCRLGTPAGLLHLTASLLCRISRRWARCCATPCSWNRGSRPACRRFLGRGVTRSSSRSLAGAAIYSLRGGGWNERRDGASRSRTVACDKPAIAMGAAARARIRPAARRDEPSHPERRVHPVPVGAAAHFVSLDVHSLFRRARLVPPRALFAARRYRGGRHGVGAARLRLEPRFEARHPDSRRRALHPMHAVPRRTASG